ncbi:DUF7485 domain-containing protein [Tessaracoccus sp. G1721]
MIRPASSLVGALAVALGVAGCAPGPPSPTPTASGSASQPASPSPATTQPSPTPSESLLDFTAGEPVLLEAPGELGPDWSELLSLPYGEADDQLGTSLGGDGEGLEWGPSYGTQLPDGTWWILDAANFRLAHYDETGGYLGDAPLPEEHLAQGEYFQWQSPQALADGTLVLQSTTPDRPGLLRLSADGTFSQVDMAEFVALKTTDGETVFGFDEEGAPVAVDPSSGAISPVGDFTGQAGLAYTVETEPGSISVTLGELTTAIPLTAAEYPDALLYPVIEAATGTDGVLTLLINGIVELEPGTAVDTQALLRIDEAGRGTVEPLPPLTSGSDPGDGARLGIRLGDDRPWLMIVGDDALTVYRRG